MPKRTPTTPAFLKKKLERQKFSLVREQFPRWVKSSEDTPGEKPEMSMELLYDFIDHLGFHDAQFRNLKPEVIKTTHAGTNQIYDYIRKHLGRHDERKVSTPGGKTKSKSTPPKTPPSKSKTDDQIKDEPPVAVTAMGKSGYAEEKVVGYRKEKQSSEGMEPTNSEVS